jgi:hypothetical protein
MLNPIRDQNIRPRGRGLGRLRGDDVPGVRSMPGDAPVGSGPLPGDARPSRRRGRMAGSRIRGLAQNDPTIYARLFA